MQDLQSLSLRHVAGRLQLLDQQGLPQKEIWIEITSPDEMVACIKKLQVRGAPLIGVAAALALAKYSESGASKEDFIAGAQALRQSRPTAVNLMWSIDLLLELANRDYSPSAIVEAAEKIFLEDVSSCEQIGKNGAKFIEDGDSIITHCNTGGLATSGRGTALAVLQTAHEQGKKIHVFVDETRPLLQGGRLTTWELEKLGIPYTLICDNMAATLMAEGKIQRIIVGADRIASNGDFANKVGTYGLAVLACYHKIPFYVAAPYTTVDSSCSSGRDIPIEQRMEKEVRGVEGAFGTVRWAPLDASVYNPAFDVTPCKLVTAWVLDRQNIFLDDIEQGALLSMK